MFVGRFMRSVGRAREAAELSERAYRLNAFDPLYQRPQLLTRL
jgi:hypothetical protein